MQSIVARLALILTYVICVCFHCESRKIRSRVIRTHYGPIRGRIMDLELGPKFQHVEQFLGVPYASPPVDHLRFMPPVTCDPWTAIRPADSPGSVCLQNIPDIGKENMMLRHFRYVKRLLRHVKKQSEDCLHLSIYTPSQGRCI